MLTRIGTADHAPIVIFPGLDRLHHDGSTSCWTTIALNDPPMFIQINASTNNLIDRKYNPIPIDYDTAKS